MKQVQQISMAEQMKLDEESLQRIRAAEDAKKVSRVDADSPWCRGSAETRGQGSVQFMQSRHRCAASSQAED